MAELSNYVRNIAVFIIFMGFVSIIIPGDKYEKYVNLVMGIILVFMALSPMTRIFGNVAAGEILPFSVVTETASLRSLEQDIQSAGNAQAENIIANYHAELIAQLERLVNTGSEYTFIRGRFDIDVSQEHFGRILRLDLTVSQTSATSPASAGQSRNLVNIDPIRIEVAVNTRGENRGNTEQNGQSVESGHMVSLKNLISNFYNMDTGNIHITIETN